MRLGKTVENQLWHEIEREYCELVGSLACLETHDCTTDHLVASICGELGVEFITQQEMRLLQARL